MQNQNEFSIALVGRPNVGKSSLFNVLCKKRLALVKDQPGVTRDLRKGYASWWGEDFTVCDTGGWTNAEDVISKAIRTKLKTQLEKFDLLVFVCDGRQGVTADDKDFFRIVRELDKPFVVAINKCDTDSVSDIEFYSLGVDEFYKISCEHKIGVDMLVEKISEFKKTILASRPAFEPIVEVASEMDDEALTSPSIDIIEAEAAVDGELYVSDEEGLDFTPEITEEDEWEAQEWDKENDETIRERDQKFSITVVGKPNVGKSSLVNRILKKDQQLVSTIAGTTTDTLSFKGSHNELDFTIYDTAGVRRKAKTDGGLEGLTMIKSLQTIDESEFVLLVFDGTDLPSRGEAKLIERCIQKSKPFLIVVNKWDLVKDIEDVNKKTFKQAIIDEFHFLHAFEVVYVSAKTGSGVDKLFDKIHLLREKLSKRIGTGELNRFFEKAIKLAPSPFYHNKPVKLYYITQTRQRTPSFLCFANHPKGVTPSYRRFLENRIREAFDFNGVPVRVFFLPKNSAKRGARFND